MIRKLVLQPHRSVDDNLQVLFQAARDVTRRNPYQFIWLLAKGHSTRDVTGVTGYSRDWIRQLAQRYNQHAPQGHGD